MRHLYIFIISMLCILCAQTQQALAMTIETTTHGESEDIYNFDQTPGKAELLDLQKLTDPTYRTNANKGRPSSVVCETNNAQVPLYIFMSDAQSGCMLLLNTKGIKKMSIYLFGGGTRGPDHPQQLIFSPYGRISARKNILVRRDTYVQCSPLRIGFPNNIIKEESEATSLFSKGTQQAAF
ncbi:MAG: hypothetical protein K6D91_07195 [Prevotella sp.]|nr:hypothetical protein [Prevotella sp.]